MRGPGDRCRRHQDQADRQQQNRSKILPKISSRGEDRCRINEQWKEKEEDQLGLQFQHRQMRNEAEGEPGKDEQNRIRQLEFFATITSVST